MKQLNRFCMPLLLLTLVAGCSNGSNPTSTVFAQSAYSNASVTGTYAFQGSNDYLQNGGIGTLVLDGAGHVGGGTETVYFPTYSCTFTFSGTYSIQSTGAGTASLITTPTTGQNSSCLGNTIQLLVEAASSGSNLLFMSTSISTGGVFSGTAVKQ